MVKNPSANAGDISNEGWIPGLGNPLEEGIATHSSILAWRFLWTEEPGGLSSTGSQRVGHDWSDMACTQWKKVFLGNWCSTVFSRENWGLLATFCSTPPHSCFCPVGGKFSQEHNTRWCCCIYAKPAAGPATEAVCRFHLESVKQVPKAGRERFCIC